jgi:hypothetical protein
VERRHSRVSRSPAHDILEDAALTRWPLPRRPGSHPRPYACTCTCSRRKGVAQRQVFGLMGRPIALRMVRSELLVAVASQSERFGPVLLTAVVPTHRCGAAPDSHRVPCWLTPSSRGEPLRGIRYVVEGPVSMARLSQVQNAASTGYSRAPVPGCGIERTVHDAAVVANYARVFDDLKTPW